MGLDAGGSVLMLEVGSVMMPEEWIGLLWGIGNHLLVTLQDPEDLPLTCLQI